MFTMFGRKPTRAKALGCIAVVAAAIAPTATQPERAHAYSGPSFAWTAKPARAGVPARVDVSLKATSGGSKETELDLFRLEIYLPAGTDFGLSRVANCSRRDLTRCPARSVVGSGTAAGVLAGSAPAAFKLTAVKHGSAIALIADPASPGGGPSLDVTRVIPEKNRLFRSPTSVVTGWQWGFGFGAATGLPGGLGFALTSLHLRFDAVRIGRCPATHRWRAGVNLRVGNQQDLDRTVRNLPSFKSIACT